MSDTPEPTFRKELQDLINKHFRENGSDTPDFILAMFLDRCLSAFDAAVKIRTGWYSSEGTTPEQRAELEK